MSGNNGFKADWAAHPRVHTRITTRTGGASIAPYDSFNLGQHVGDAPEHVEANRALLRAQLPAEPVWLNQVHGTAVVEADKVNSPPDADASVTRRSETVCAVMTADCLPVLLADRQGTVVAAAHAGWRGLCHGVIEATLASMGVAPGEVMAWLGPAIGPDAFEVGAEVRQAFIDGNAADAAAFTPIGDDKHLADIYHLARLRLHRAGVSDISGGDFCTVIERDKFFSYRRDGVTGRMASLIWLQD